MPRTSRLWRQEDQVGTILYYTLGSAACDAGVKITCLASMRCWVRIPPLQRMCQTFHAEQGM